MNLDDHWLNDEQMAALGRRIPSTAFGKELTPKWAARYQGLLSSDTYRGCAIVLETLFKLLQGRAPTLAAIEQTILGLDEGFRRSKVFQAGTALTGGASLAIVNALQSTRSGVAAHQVVAAYDSEAIYAAGRFIEARRRELAGERLP
jgi:hypothetical protein